MKAATRHGPIFASVVILLAIATASNGLALASSANSCLVSWWPADGSANDALDANNGTWHGGEAYAPGVVGSAFRFDGNGSYVLVPYDTSFDFTPRDDLSLTAWVGPDPAAPGRRAALIVKSPVSGFWDWGLYLTPDGRFLSGRHDTDAVVSRTAAQPGRWYHVAVVYTGRPRTIKLYVNGTLESQKSGFVITQSTGAIGIGTNGEAVRPDQYCGGIDDVRVYARALNESEIVDMYHRSPSSVPDAHASPSPAPPPTGTPLPALCGSGLIVLGFLGLVFIALVIVSMLGRLRK